MINFPGATKAFSYARLLQVVNLPDEDPYDKVRVALAQEALQKFLQRKRIFPDHDSNRLPNRRCSPTGESDLLRRTGKAGARGEREFPRPGYKRGRTSAALDPLAQGPL